MAVARVNPGLTKSTRVTVKNKYFSDIDLSFSAKTGSPDENGNYSGDIYKKVDVRAVEQSVQNILMTNTLEKPYQPSFGANIRAMLFEPTISYSEDMISTSIVNEIKRLEPRAKVTSVKYYTGDELIESGIESFGKYVSNEIRIVIDLQIDNKGFTTQINLNRFR